VREVVLTVPRLAVEDVLDRLLLVVPGGVREQRAGRHVELRMRGEGVPAASEIERAVGRWPHKLSEHQVSDDWRERRLADYEPDVIGGRLVVRPEWAPAPEAGLIDIALGEGAAFGGGTHPTTRTCLELLLELAPSGAFADLGCGTGVLAILAARLGWAPVVAVDVQPGSVVAAHINAERNGVTVEARVADLSTQAPPPAGGIAANVPAELHELIASALPDPIPEAGLLSGFGPEDVPAVLAAYGHRGLSEARRVERLGWAVLLVDQG
jgi:ribosomal protein L11 methyltransferase